MGMMKKKEVKRMAIGSVVALMSSAIIFSGASQGVKALEVSKKQVVETNYNIPSYDSVIAKTPLDYEQQDYEVKFVGKAQPTAKDLTVAEAAELASQHLWSVFGAKLSGETIEVNYTSATKTQPRAKWEATVKVNDNLSYDVMIDAVTGEIYSVGKRTYHEANIREGLNQELLESHEEYEQIVKDVAEKHQFFTTGIKTIDYISQGYDKNEINNKNANITFQVIAEDGKKAQLTISTYNQELLSIEYDGWLKEAERLEHQLIEESDDVIRFKITDELIKEVERTKTPIIINE